MNKEEFIVIIACNSDDNTTFPATIRKSDITAIVRMDDGKAGIFINNTNFISANSYEDTLIDLFNESIPNNSISR